MTKKKVRAQDIVTEALSWVGTAFGHQQSTKGVMVDCANFIREVSTATGATPDVDFEKNYRRREDGTQMLRELISYLEPVESFDEVKLADIVALHDGKDKNTPRHLAFISQLEPYPKIVHASERGVRAHRLDLHFKGRIHSIWRRPGLLY
jgi:hypothetical protein